MPRQNLGYQRLEFDHCRRVNKSTLFFRQRLLQRAALIHRSRSDNSACIRDSFKSCEFSGCEFHLSSLLMLQPCKNKSTERR